MEASQFTQGEELDVAENPFGEDGMGDFKQGEDPFEAAAPVTEEPLPGLPVVDAEGNTLEPEPANVPTQDAPQEKEKELDPTTGAGPYDADSPGGSEALLPPLKELSDPELIAIAGGEDAAEADEAKKLLAQRGDQRAVEIAGAARSTLSPAQVGSDGRAIEKLPPAPATEATPVAAKATPAKREKAHATVRGYYVLVPEGDGKFMQLEWYEDKDGNATTKEKGKKTKVANVAGKREALALGFTALGEPSAGAKLVAVPVSYFEIKTVKGKDNPPPRRRPVSIS